MLVALRPVQAALLPDCSVGALFDAAQTVLRPELLSEGAVNELVRGMVGSGATDEL
jgi:hypothetical protein